MSWGECRACGEDLVNGEGTCDECLQGLRTELNKIPDRLRSLASHLETRSGAPSLDGYELVDGLRAAADLLESKPGPLVHSDCLPGSDEFQPKVALSMVLTTPQSGEACPACDGLGSVRWEGGVETKAAQNAPANVSCRSCGGRGRRSG